MSKLRQPAFLLGVPVLSIAILTACESTSPTEADAAGDIHGFAIDVDAPVPPAPAGEVFQGMVELRPMAPGDEEPIQRIPSLDALLDELGLERDEGAVALGERLFHDPRLSATNTVSCASCHDLRHAGVDRGRTAIGERGQVRPTNTPTVFNAGLQTIQFWDGRAGNLTEQAGGAPMHVGDLGATWAEVLSKLTEDFGYVTEFREVFGLGFEDPIEKEHVQKALAAFEATLLTPGSRFDEWLAGDAEAITEEENLGYQLFKQVGCADCHFGPAVGGRALEPLGAKNPFFVAVDEVRDVDLGRFNVTKDEGDRHVFKVPGLRNVAVTAPYFHDGSRESLEQAVRDMGLYQLDIQLSDREVDLLVKFLGALTGTWRGQPLDSSWR